MKYLLVHKFPLVLILNSGNLFSNDLLDFPLSSSRDMMNIYVGN